MTTRTILPLGILFMLTACSNEAPAPEQDAQAGPSMAVAEVVDLTGVWQVEDINQGGIVDRSMITMDLTETGSIAGSGGCNRYNNSIEFDGTSITMGNGISTKMACVPALMDQEHLFLMALAETVSFEVEKDTWLIFKDAEGEQRIKAIRQSDSSGPEDSEEAPPEVTDKASTTSMVFDCDDGGSLAARYVGPDTFEIKHEDEVYIATIERSASGAKYVGDGIMFWNKGDEAMVEVGGEDLKCSRASA